MSSKHGRVPLDMWETYRAMSVDVGQIYKFMNETAMMHTQEAELIAYCETAKLFFKDAKFTKYINELVIPYLQMSGRARRKRDIVTDLGFALAGRKSRRKKLGSGSLDYNPTSD